MRVYILIYLWIYVGYVSLCAGFVTAPTAFVVAQLVWCHNASLHAVGSCRTLPLLVKQNAVRFDSLTQAKPSAIHLLRLPHDDCLVLGLQGARILHTCCILKACRLLLQIYIFIYLYLILYTCMYVYIFGMFVVFGLVALQFHTFGLPSCIRQPHVAYHNVSSLDWHIRCVCWRCLQSLAASN